MDGEGDEVIPHHQQKTMDTSTISSNEQEVIGMLLAQTTQSTSSEGQLGQNANVTVQVGFHYLIRSCQGNGSWYGEANNLNTY